MNNESDADTLTRLMVQLKIFEAGVEDHEQGFRTIIAWLKTDLLPRLENLEREVADMRANAVYRDIVLYPRKDERSVLPPA